MSPLNPFANFCSWKQKKSEISHESILTVEILSCHNKRLREAVSANSDFVLVKSSNKTVIPSQQGGTQQHKTGFYLSRSSFQITLALIKHQPVEYNFEENSLTKNYYKQLLFSCFWWLGGLSVLVRHLIFHFSSLSLVNKQKGGQKVVFFCCWHQRRKVILCNLSLILKQKLMSSFCFSVKGLCKLCKIVFVTTGIIQGRKSFGNENVAVCQN